MDAPTATPIAAPKAMPNPRRLLVDLIVPNFRPVPHAYMQSGRFCGCRAARKARRRRRFFTQEHDASAFAYRMLALKFRAQHECGIGERRAFGIVERAALEYRNAAGCDERQQQFGDRRRRANGADRAARERVAQTRVVRRSFRARRHDFSAQLERREGRFQEARLLWRSPPPASRVRPWRWRAESPANPRRSLRRRASRPA